MITIILHLQPREKAAILVNSSTIVVDSSNSIVLLTAMADPDLQIRGGGGHPDPEITGGGLQKDFFFALRASFWSKNKGGPGAPRTPPLDSPLSSIFFY